MKICYSVIFSYENKKYVGIDSDSGGYPFYTDLLPIAKIWIREDYKSYMKTNAKEALLKNWVVLPVMVGAEFQ